MKTKSKQGEGWPRKVQPGRAIVPVYRRLTPQGNFAYMVANYADGERRRFDSYANEADALTAADTLAKRIDKRDYVAASMTQKQAVEYAACTESLRPFGITLTAAVAAVVAALEITGDLAGMATATRFYKAKYKTVTAKSVPDVVTELLALKETRGASDRYSQDLRLRLEKFADKFTCNIGNVTTAEVQTWLDGLKLGSVKLGSQSYANYRRVIHLLFEHAVARGYCLDNPAAKVERPKIRNGEIEIFTPDEARRLLSAATKDFLPCLAIGLFAGLRSAEIERLEWKDIDLPQGHIVVGASTAKTASRRIVPIGKNLAEWLKPYAGRAGKVWKGQWFYREQEDCAKATEIKANKDMGIKAQKPVTWKANGCRHSFASYSFALCNDAGRVAGFMGNSPAMIHRHYKQLCTPADAQKFFSIKPPQSKPALASPRVEVIAS
jgi:integrase